MSELELLERIAMGVEASAIPPNMRWLDRAGAAAFMGISLRKFDGLSAHPDFAKASYALGDRPRWLMSELNKFMGRG